MKLAFIQYLVFVQICPKAFHFNMSAPYQRPYRSISINPILKTRNLSNFDLSKLQSQHFSEIRTQMLKGVRQVI